jgi:hypothetical protein
MRPPFSDTDKLKDIAKYKITKGIGRLEHWWSSKYNLPPNHHLFLERSIGSLNVEMYIELFLKKEELELDLENASGKEYSDILNRLRRVNDALGEAFSEDPLIDKWEKEISEGKLPNLEER